MVSRIPLHQLDPSGAATNQVVTWNGSEWVPADAATGVVPSAGRSPRLVPYGVKLRGVNIVSINMTGGTTSDPWGELFSDAANFDTVIQPQVDLAAATGVNAIRCMDGIGWVHNGDTLLADNLANYERFVDYCANLGVYVYACLSDAAHWAGATKAQALAIFEPLAEMLDSKPNVIAVDVIQEIGLNFATISGGQTLHDFLADVLGDLRDHTTLPLTCSNTHSSNNSTAQWSSSTIAAVDDVVDFHDFHPYYNGMVPSDLDPVFTVTAKPVVLGEYGAGTSEPTRTNRITAAAAVSALSGVVGSFYWAVTDYNATDPSTAWGLYDSTFAARPAPITAFQTVPDREGSLPGAGHIVEDEGTVLPQRSRLNFKGDVVSATDNPTDDSTDVTIDGATLEVKDEGTSVEAATTSVDFVGADVAATSDGSGNVTVTVSASSSPGYREVLMASGVSFPAEPLESTSGGDWLYGEVAP